MVDLRDGELAVLAQVAKHVRLALQVRGALPVQLRDEGRAVLKLYPVDLADATATHRPGAPETLAEVLLYPFGENLFQTQPLEGALRDQASLVKSLENSPGFPRLASTTNPVCHP